LTFIPALRTAFRTELDLSLRGYRSTPHGAFAGYGAAMVDENRACCYRISELIELLSTQPEGDSTAKNRLRPLFADEAEWSVGK